MFQRLIDAILNLLFPVTCAACGKLLLFNERVLCTKCMYYLPKTYYHGIFDNPVSKIFWGRVYIQHATSFFFYTKGNAYQNMIHELKYRGNKDVGQYLGELFGLEIKESVYYQDIDYIIPVPLHPRRKKERGYNQSEVIGEGLSKSLGVPVCANILIRARYTETQTKKDKTERWKNVNTAFEVSDSKKLENKRLLLVDDILTTGATLEACAAELLKCNGVKVNIVTLGFSYEI